jgi:hypothetical protein
VLIVSGDRDGAIQMVNDDVTALSERPRVSS